MAAGPADPSWPRGPITLPGAASPGLRLVKVPPASEIRCHSGPCLDPYPRKGGATPCGGSPSFLPPKPQSRCALPCSWGDEGKGRTAQRRPGAPPALTLGALCPPGLLRPRCPPRALGPLRFLCRLLTLYLDLLSVWRLLCPGGQRSWGPGSVSWFTARTPPPHRLSRRVDAKEHLPHVGSDSVYPSSF